MDNPQLRSIRDYSKAIADGLSPVTLVETCLQRIAEHNGDLRAMISVDATGALAAAAMAEREIRAGRSLGPLHGIPVAIKDVIDVEGWPTTAGSRLFDGHVAKTDAACVANLKAAGAVIIGKTNLHELTVGTHDNPWFGKVVNPLDRTRGTGGTSSGSVAAVAAGFCVAAVGTDTGGSNRSTAAATGLVGFKPSNGLIDSSGARPTAGSLDTIGPITVTVNDARIMTEAMLGRLLDRPEPAMRGRSLAGLRLALCPDLYASAVDPEVEAAHEIWLEDLRCAGVVIREISLGNVDEFVAAGLDTLQHEFAAHYAALIERHPDRVSQPVRQFVEGAKSIDQTRLQKARAIRSRWTATFMEKLDGFDLLAIPPTPGLAPLLDGEVTRVGEDFVPYGPAGGRFRRWANMFGMPAIALPLPTTEGLPASIQLAMPAGKDGALLDLADAIMNRQA